VNEPSEGFWFVTLNPTKGGASDLIERVKLWVAGVPTPLLAVNTISLYVPAVPCAGVPESTPPLNVTPCGRKPDSEI